MRAKEFQVATTETRRTESIQCHAFGCPLPGTFGAGGENSHYYCTFHSVCRVEENDQVTLGIKKWLDVIQKVHTLKTFADMPGMVEYAKKRNLPEDFYPRKWKNSLGRTVDEMETPFGYANRILSLIQSHVRPRERSHV
jgi:hypothetical protein